MFPQVDIVRWRAVAPWADDDDVEQDLVITLPRDFENTHARDLVDLELKVSFGATHAPHNVPKEWADR